MLQSRSDPKWDEQTTPYPVPSSCCSESDSLRTPCGYTYTNADEEIFTDGCLVTVPEFFYFHAIHWAIRLTSGLMTTSLSLPVLPLALLLLKLSASCSAVTSSSRKMGTMHTVTHNRPNVKRCKFLVMNFKLKKTLLSVRIKSINWTWP